MLRFDEKKQITIDKKDFEKPERNVILAPLSDGEEEFEERPRFDEIDHSNDKRIRTTKIMLFRPRIATTAETSIADRASRGEKTIEDSFQGLNRTQSITFMRTKSQDKTPPNKNFVLNRRGSTDSLKRSSSAQKIRQQPVTTTSTDNISISTTAGAWKLIVGVIRRIAKHIQSLTLQKMFSRDLIKRVMQIIEKKKDTIARIEMRKLEVKYGKKVALLYDKGHRFMFMKSVEKWNGADMFIEKAFRVSFIEYQLYKLDSIFLYGERLFKRTAQELSQSMKLIPRLSENFRNTLYREKSRFWIIRDIQLYKRYVYLTEKQVQQILQFVSNQNREVLREIKQLQQQKMEHSISKKTLLQLVEVLHIHGEKNTLMSQCKKDPLQQRIIEIVAKRATERLDWQLTNLFLGFSFFTYYCAKKNFEKGYIILSRAYEANKDAINIFVSTYVKYKCARNQLDYYLNKSQRADPKKVEYKDLSYHEYMEELVQMESRLPYLYEYIDTNLSSCITIEELKELFRAAGQTAFDLGDYSRAVLYYENFMFMIDSVDRVEIHRFLSRQGELKEEKVDKLLILNKTYMKYNNKILRACFEIKDYVKALTLIVNLLFIFYNSLNLINYFDPNSHPTKKPNEVIMMDLKTFNKISEEKLYYKGLLMFYIEEWKITMEFHAKIWNIVSRQQHTNEFRKPFFIAFRESIGHIEALTVYNLPNYLAFVKRYTNLPDVLTTAKPKRSEKSDLTIQNYQTQKHMDYYFPTYVGDYDKSFLEFKVLESIYMNSENEQRLLSLNSLKELREIKSVFRDTEAFSTKRMKKLMVWEVQAYFTLGFEDHRLINHLYRNVLKNYYIKNKKYRRDPRDFYNTVMRDADQETIKEINDQFSILGSHWRDVLYQRRLEKQKAENRKLLKWSDRVILEQLPYESQEKLNNIRKIELRSLNPEIHGHSRFYQERKLELGSKIVEDNINEYFSKPINRSTIVAEFERKISPQNRNRKQNLEIVTKKQTRRSLSADRNASKDQLAGGDKLNMEINTEIYYRMHYRIHQILEALRRSSRKTKIKQALGKIQGFRGLARSKVSIPSLPTFQNLEPENANKEEGDYFYVDLSLADIQKRVYSFDIIAPRSKRTKFKTKIRINGSGIELQGEIKSSRSFFAIKKIFNFPFSVDLIAEKENFIIGFPFVFQSYWPILFEQFKKNYSWVLYHLSKDHTKELMGTEDALYKNFAQNMGLGFDLEYTNYKDPIEALRHLSDLKFYRKQDFHSLQLLLNNMTLIIQVLDSLITRRLTGYTAQGIINLQSVSEYLTTRNINLGVLFFLERWVCQRNIQSRLVSEDLLVSRRSHHDTVLPPLDQWFRDHLRLFMLKVQIVERNQGNRGLLNLFVCRKVVRFLNIESNHYSLDLRLNIHTSKVEENIKFMTKMLSDNVENGSNQETRDRFVLLLLFAFLEKTIEFEIHTSNFFLQKVKHYTEDPLKITVKPQSEKYIIRRNRFFKVNADQVKMSFLQFYYLSQSRLCPSVDRTDNLDQWDFSKLINKESVLSLLKQDFDENFSLQKEIIYCGDSLRRIFESILSNPLTNFDFRDLGLRMFSQAQSFLMCFLREKSLFHVLEFQQEDSILIRKQFSEFIFEYDKLRTYINPQKKFEENSIFNDFNLIPDETTQKRGIFKIKNLNGPNNLQDFLKTSKETEKQKRIGPLVRLERGLIKINQQFNQEEQNIEAQAQDTKDNLKTLKAIELQKKTQEMDNLFNPNFQQIMQTGIAEWRHSTENDIGVKLEIFDQNSEIIAKGTLIFKNSNAPIMSSIKRYCQMKEKSAFEFAVNADPKDVPHYQFTKNVYAQCNKDWHVDFNVSRDDFCHLQILNDSDRIRIVKKFVNNPNRPHDLKEGFNLLCEIFYQSFKDRLLITHVRLQIYYPFKNMHLKMVIHSESSILYLLRILSMRSHAAMYIQLSHFFGSQFAHYLPSILGAKKNKFCEEFRNDSTQETVVVIPIDRTNWKEPISGDMTVPSLIGYFEKKMTGKVPEDKDRWQKELRILNKKEALTKSLSKPSNSGFLNPVIAKRIHKMKNNPNADKLGILNFDELTGHPRKPSKNAKHFHFFFRHTLKGSEPVYVTADVFLVLQWTANKEEQLMFEDAHTVSTHYLETLANRLKQISRLYFRDAEMCKTDAKFIRLQLLRQKAMKVTGREEGGMIKTLEKWRETLGKADDQLSQYQNSELKSSGVKASKDTLIRMVDEIRLKHLEEDRLVLDGENLVFNFELVPCESRTKVHKLVLNWQDIRQFFVNQEFIIFLFKNVANYAHAQKYFSSVSPKLLFIELMRYILNFCAIQRQRLYRLPTILIDYKRHRQFYLKNTASRFRPVSRLGHHKSTEMLSKNSQVVFHGVRQIHRNYFVVSVAKNRYLRVWEVTFYSPRYCRQYCMVVGVSATQNTQQMFLCKLARLIHHIPVDRSSHTFESFDQLWGDLNGRPLHDSIHLYSEVSGVWADPVSVNDSALDAESSSDGRPSPLYKTKDGLLTAELSSRHLVGGRSQREYVQPQNGRSVENIQNIADLCPFSTPMETLEDLKTYLASTSEHLHSTEVLRYFKEVEDQIFCSNLLDDLKVNETPFYLVSKTSATRAQRIQFSQSLKRILDKLFMFVETQFWDEVCGGLQISYQTEEGVSRLVVRVEEEVHYMRELHCSRDFINSRGEDTTCRVFLNLNKLKHLHTDQQTREVQSDGQKVMQFQRIGEPFPKTQYELTSLLYFEVQMFLTSVDESGRTRSLKTTKYKNVKELLNLLIAEHHQNADLAVSKQFTLGDFRVLGEFLIYKLQHSEALNMMVEKQAFEEMSDLREHSLLDSKLTSVEAPSSPLME